ncbi:MAG: hypothetical protein KJ063_08985 [Anaerolineae bacterium]|nr:hypothetical protein [Anaerolineae bacterium]
MKYKDYLWLAIVGLLFQGIWLLLRPQPAYMDAYYYASNGQRLAEGHGWTEMVIWQYLDDPQGVPAPSHSYWMPLSSLLAAAGYLVLPSFRGMQLPFWLLTGLLPLLSYHISHKLGGERWQNIAAALFTLSGGFFLPNWNQPETFAPFAWAGAVCLLLMGQLAGGSEQSSRLTPQHSLLIGLFAALAHLTRADGVLLLGIAILITLTPKLETSTSKLKTNFLIILGYLLLMSPWFSHNLRVSGGILPTTGTQTIFLTDYDDLFAYGRTFDLNHYLAWGISNIVRSKLMGMWQGLQTFITVNGLIFLTPFVLLGGWVRWREGKQGWLRPLLLYTLFLYAAMSLVFTFPGERGGLFHSAAALWPWFMALVPVGIGWGVEWLAQRLPHWQPERAKRLFTGLFIGVALVMSLALGLTRGSVDAAAQLYPEIAPLLPDGVAVMVGNAPGFYYHTGYPAYSIPNEPIETMLAAAARYHITYLILDENHPRPLAVLYQNPALHPDLDLIGTMETIQIYQIRQD